MPHDSPTCAISMKSSANRVRFAANVRSLAVLVLQELGRDREAGLQLFGGVTDGLVEIMRIGEGTLGDHERLAFDFSTVPDDLVGDIHSHPSRNVLPSPTDLTAWSELRRSMKLETYAGVITCPSVNGEWTMVPWLVRQGSDGRDVAERCALFA